MGAINDFAFAFLVGIITGTYSSIFIASALVLWWHKGERPKIGAEVILDRDRRRDGRSEDQTRLIPPLAASQAGAGLE